MAPPPRFAAVQALKKYGRAGAARPQKAEAGSACLCKTMSIVPRNCSYDPLNCGRTKLLVLATAGIVGQTAHLPCLSAAGADLRQQMIGLCVNYF